MRKAAFTLLLFAALASLPPFALATNGAKLISSGPRAGGRGGVDTGFADDATAMNTNPGGIGFIDGQRFDSASAWVHPNVRFSGRNANENDDRDPSGENLFNTFGGAFAVAFDFDEPWHLGEALTFEDSGEYRYEPRTSPTYAGSGIKLGFGVFPLKGAHQKFHGVTPFWDEDPSKNLPRERKLYYADIKEINFVFAAAFRLTNWLSIGIAPSFIWGEVNQSQPVAEPVSILKGHVGGESGDLTYSKLAPFAGIPDGQIRGFSEIRRARTYGWRVRIGALFQPADFFSFGISYASPAWKLEYLGKAHVDFSRQIEKVDDPDLIKGAVAADTGIPPEDQTYIANYDLKLKSPDEPQEVSLGIAFRFEYVAFGFDLTWINWAGTYKRLEARLEHGTSGELNELTGDTSRTTRPVFPLEWNDQLVFAAGVAFQPADWVTIRTGYNYGKNPIPENTLQPGLPGIIEHHVTVGLTFYIKRIEITLNYEHDFRSKVDIRKSKVDHDLEGTTVEAEIDFFTLGFGVRF
jgi:long-subunit fatty acid transport protein